MTTTWIRAAYGVGIAVLLAVTVAAGVSVFTAGPRPPQPLGLSFQQLSGNTSDAETARITQQIDSFYSDAGDYRRSFPDYQRNIFLWYAGLGILLAVIGTALPAVVNYLRFGFVLGGILLIGAGTWFTLQDIPSPISPAANGILSLLVAGTPAVLDTASRFLRFAIAIVGLLVMLFVGLWRLTDWNSVPVRLVAVPTQPVQPAPATPPLQTIPAAGPDPTPAAGTRWARPSDTADAAFQPVAPVEVTQPSQPAAGVETAPIAPPDGSGAPPVQSA